MITLHLELPVSAPPVGRLSAGTGWAGGQAGRAFFRQVHGV